MVSIDAHVRATLVKYVPDDEDLPFGLTWDKIDDRAFDFSETQEGLIRFRIMRHPTFPGLSTRSGGPSPARWHIRTVYTFDPKTKKWEEKTEQVSFAYDIDLIVDDIKFFLDEGGIYDDIRNDVERKELIINDEIQNVINYYSENREYAVYPIDDDIWESMMDEISRALRKRILKQLELN